MTKILMIVLPDPPGTHVFRFNSAGFGSSIALPNQKYKFDVFPPIFESYAAAVLENQGHEVRILDCQSPNWRTEEILKEIERQKPTMIVSGICLPSYYHDLEIIAKIKELFPKVLLIGWGGVCKNSAQEILEQSQLDAVFRTAELEEILPDFVRAVEENKIESVAGLSFKKNREIHHTVDRAFNKNLDAIPIPAYHLLDMKKYVAQEDHYIRGGSSSKYIPFFSLSGSRGCSFNCSYCPYPLNYGPWRGRSPEKIVDEIEVLVKKYGVHAIWFNDQTLSMIPKRTFSLCNEIIERGLDIHWATETRIDSLTPEVLRKMKESGCGRLEIGVETGDQTTLETVGKRGLTLDKAKKTADAIKHEGILLETNFLVGLPGETWPKIRKTAELIKEINPDFLCALIFTPYLGTPIYAMIEKNGWLIEKDWRKYTLHKAVFSMPSFTAKDIEAGYHYLCQRYEIDKTKKEASEAWQKRKLIALSRKMTKLIALFPASVKNNRRAKAKK